MTLLTMTDPKWPNLQIVEVSCDHCNVSGREHGETVDSAIAKLRILGWTIEPGDHTCMYHKDLVGCSTHPYPYLGAAREYGTITTEKISENEYLHTWELDAKAHVEGV